MMAVGPIFGPANINFPKRFLENLKCRDQAIGPGWAGTFIKHLMLAECEKYGVEIMTEHAAVDLLTDESGSIKTVVAQDAGGFTYIDCGVCILATGGSGRSDEKLKKYFPEFFEGESTPYRFSVPTDTGDAMDLITKLGGALEENRMNVSILGPGHHPYSYCIHRFMLAPEVIEVNLNGERYHSEVVGGFLEGAKRAEQLTEQPNQISYTIFTQELIDMLAKREIENPAMADEAWIYKDYMKEIQDEINLNDKPAQMANTLEELAIKIGVEPDKLVSTINWTGHRDAFRREKHS